MGLSCKNKLVHKHLSFQAWKFIPLVRSHGRYNISQLFIIQPCTLLENLKLCPKIQFSEKFKIVNLNFTAKKQWFLKIFKCHFYLDNLNFRAKIVILCQYRTKNNWKLLNFDNFWREISKSKRNQCVIFIIIDWFLAQKFKFTILLFFLKNEFLDTIWDFLTVWFIIHHV